MLVFISLTLQKQKFSFLIHHFSRSIYHECHIHVSPSRPWRPRSCSTFTSSRTINYSLESHSFHIPIRIQLTIASNFWVSDTNTVSSLLHYYTLILIFWFCVSRSSSVSRFLIFESSSSGEFFSFINSDS